jgi:dTDP-4-amino-4,6-dideoxygalactose transaminase
MRKVNFLDLASQYEGIKDEVDSAIDRVLKSASFIGGTNVAKFEEDFADFVGTRECVGVANGTDALEIVLESLDLPSDSEVIVPANSFIATSEAVSRAGLRVVFADCRPDDYLLDVDDVRTRITEKTRAIVPVHLYGQMCDMEALGAVAEEFSLRIIEDAAQAHGAKFREKKVCDIGDFATFSFYPGKNLGAYGDAGAIVCNDRRFAKKCRMLANHGRSSKYDHKFEGRNSRIDGLQAAILAVKLGHLSAWIDRRQRCAEIYLRELNAIEGLTLPRVHGDREHVFHLFVVRCEDRDDLRTFLNQYGVQTGIHYPIALPDLAAYAHLNQSGKFTASGLSRKLLSLPIGEHLTDDDIKYVCEIIRTFFAQA